MANGFRIKKWESLKEHTAAGMTFMLLPRLPYTPRIALFSIQISVGGWPRAPRCLLQNALPSEAIIYYRFAEDSPNGQQKLELALVSRSEVSSRKGLALWVLIQIPIYTSLGTLVWTLFGHPLSPLFLFSLSHAIYDLILIVFVIHIEET